MSTKRKGAPAQAIPLQTIVKTDAAVEQATKLDGTQANAEHISKDDLIMANSVDQFAQMITAWHIANKDALTKMAEIPGDGHFTFEFEGKQVVMEGDLHTGYRMGIYAALGMFGQLPFQTFTEEVVVDEQPAPAAD